MHRIYATTLSANIGSAKVMAKLGMRLEAQELEKEFIKGRWYDSLTYAILDREWLGA